MMLPWPETVRPRRLALWLEPVVGRFASALTGQGQVLDRGADRWVAEIALDLDGARAGLLDGVLAAGRGPARDLLLPDFGHLGTVGPLAAAAVWADEIGPVAFADGSGFTDGTPWLAMRGTPRLVTGADTALVLDGFRPLTPTGLRRGDPILAAPGRVHLIVGPPPPADAWGRVRVRVLPALREPVVPGPLGGPLTLRMRLESDEAGRALTRPPGRRHWRLRLIETPPAAPRRRGCASSV